MTKDKNNISNSLTFQTAGFEDSQHELQPPREYKQDKLIQESFPQMLFNEREPSQSQKTRNTSVTNRQIVRRSLSDCLFINLTHAQLLFSSVRLWLKFIYLSSLGSTLVTSGRLVKNAPFKMAVKFYTFTNNINNISIYSLNTS